VTHSLLLGFPHAVHAWSKLMTTVEVVVEVEVVVVGIMQPVES
jgi:hypothetical protein